MTVALFAAKDVGLNVCKIFQRHGRMADYVVFNPADPQEIVEGIKNSNTGKTFLTWEEFRRSDIKFDLGILAWWPFILKQEDIDRARQGYINFHPSLLPHGRGKNPNFWSIVEGTPFGVTLHWVDDTIDGGDVAFQKQIETSWEDNGETLYARSQAAILELFEKNLDDILALTIPRVSQENGHRIHYGSELDKKSRLDLNDTMPVKDLLNLLRARTFGSYPACSFEENGDVYEVRISIARTTKPAPDKT